MSGGTYYWSVQAVDTGYAGSAFASEASIEVPEPPAPFGKTLPGDGDVDVSINPTLTWEISENATEYAYCYDTTDDDECSGQFENLSAFGVR